MDQASRIIARWNSAAGVIGHERIACGAWKRAVGKRIAVHTRALKLVRTSLVIEVEDEIWRDNLWGLRYQVLNNLEKALGPGIVTDIELRVMPLRRPPQREDRPALMPQSAESDEADKIEDPGLRRIYKMSRKRHTA